MSVVMSMYGWIKVVENGVPRHKPYATQYWKFNDIDMILGLHSLRIFYRWILKQG
jgi:hypothetical protein